jgi:hypothetical protein
LLSKSRVPILPVVGNLFAMKVKQVLPVSVS